MMESRRVVMKRLCIFDLDGTLADTLESIWYSVNETLHELKLQTITKEQCQAFVGDGARCLMERALLAGEASEMDREEHGRFLDRAMEIYGRIFHEHCTYHVTSYRGIPEMLQRLKEDGYTLAVLSNKPHEQTVRVVSELFGEGIFAYVFGQGELFPKKPDPAGIAYILKATQTERAACVYVGDSEVDMMTGKAAGVKTVGVNWGFRTEQELRDAGALYTIAKPQDLIELV